MAFNPEDNCLAEQFRRIFYRNSDEDLSMAAERFVKAAIAHDPEVLFDIDANDHIKLIFSDGSIISYFGPSAEMKPLLH
jgi:hypothetical protein